MLTEEEIKKKENSLSLSFFSLSLSMPRLIHVYVLSDDMKYKREKSRKLFLTSVTGPGPGPGEWLSFWRVISKQFWFTIFLFVCLTASLSRLIHIYVLVKLYFLVYKTCTCIFPLHKTCTYAYKTLPKLGAKLLGVGKRLWGKRFGRKWYWGRND